MSDHGAPIWDEWFPICPATVTTPDGLRVRCELEPDHGDDPHLAIDEKTRRRVRWADRP